MPRGGHVAGGGGGRGVGHLWLRDTMARGGQLTGVGHLWLRDTTQGACVKTSTATTHHHVQEPSAQRQISGLERPRRLARASVCWTGEAPRIFVPSSCSCHLHAPAAPVTLVEPPASSGRVAWRYFLCGGRPGGVPPTWRLSSTTYSVGRE